MKKIVSLIIAAILVCTLLVGCSESGGTANSGTVATDGSTSMSKVIGALGEAFENDNGITVTYNATGSGAGIQAVQENRCDIGLASRNLKDEEKASGLEQTVLAYDGIAIIVNPENTVKELDLETIAKIVSGMDAETLTKVKSVYDRIIDAGTFPVSSIKTAEAIKLVENSQRDINIAFMNEAAEVFEKIGIDTNEVVDGMNTKWNALGFRPGLVGGHCIGVDPYYFIYKAHQVGYESQIVAAGRRMNDSMGRFVAEKAVKKMVQAGLAPAQARVVILGFTFAKVAIFGLTFKENCPDVRNTRVADIVHTLEEYGICPVVVDPCADKALVQKEYGVALTDLEQVKNADCILHAVAHRQFREMGLPGLMALFRPDGGAKRVLLDVKGEWPVSQLKELEITWWRM